MVWSWFLSKIYSALPMDVLQEVLREFNRVYNKVITMGTNGCVIKLGERVKQKFDQFVSRPKLERRQEHVTCYTMFSVGP